MKKFALIAALLTSLYSTTAVEAKDIDFSQINLPNQPASAQSVKPTPTKTLKDLTPEQRQLLLPRVAVIYYNNAQTTYNKRIDHFVNEALHEAIDDQNYRFLEGTPFFNECRLAGVSDIRSAERADLMEILKPYDLDYLVYLEIEPVTVRSKGSVFSKGKTAVVSAPFKIIDMRQGKTLYNGMLTEIGKTTVMMGGVGDKSVALEGVKRVNEQVKKTIAERLPKPNF